MILQYTGLGVRKSCIFAQHFSDRVGSRAACYLWKVTFLDERFDSSRVPVHPDSVKGEDALLELGCGGLLGNLLQLLVVKLVDVLLALSKKPTVQHSPLIMRLAIREIDRVNSP